MKTHIIPKSVQIQKRPVLAVSESAVPKDVVVITKGLQSALPRLNITPNAVQRALNGEKSEVQFDKYLDVDLLQVAKQEKIPTIFFHLVLGQFEGENQLSTTNKSHFAAAKAHLNKLDGNIYAASREDEALLDAADRALSRKYKSKFKAKFKAGLDSRGELKSAAAFANLPGKSLDYLIDTLKKLDAKVEIFERDGNLVARSTRFGSKRLDDAFETMGIKCKCPWMGRSEEGDVIWQLGRGKSLSSDGISISAAKTDKVLRFIAKELKVNHAEIGDKSFSQFGVKRPQQAQLIAAIEDKFGIKLAKRSSLLSEPASKVSFVCNLADEAIREKSHLTVTEQRVGKKIRSFLESLQKAMKEKNLEDVARQSRQLSEAIMAARREGCDLGWHLVTGKVRR